MEHFTLGMENQDSAVSRIMGDGGGPDEEDNSWRPKWMKPLLKENFFGRCKIHADSQKSERNRYCLDCMNGPLCSHCLDYHKDHRSIQIRRSSYHDVIRVSDIQSALDITGVQTYTINSARVVFLNERPQHRRVKGFTNACEVCERSLLDTFRFCSLGCKVVGKSKDFVKLKKKRQRSSMVSDDDSEDPNSRASRRTGHGQRKANKKAPSFSQPTPPPKAPSCQIAKRRKGIPHRAPMGAFIIEY